TGGWIAMLQHHFFTAWIPAAGDTGTFSLATTRGAGGQQQALVRELGPGVQVAPGASAQVEARLWVGPKLVDQIEAQQVPGLERGVGGRGPAVPARERWRRGLGDQRPGRADQAADVSAAGGAAQVGGGDAQVPAAHRTAQGTLRGRQAEVPDGGDGAVQEGED